LTFLKQQGFSYLPMTRKLVRAISIVAHSQHEMLLVLFASFKLLCGQGIVRLLRCHVLVDGLVVGIQYHAALTCIV
jgi:hypothetical protein